MSAEASVLSSLIFFYLPVSTEKNIKFSVRPAWFRGGILKWKSSDPKDSILKFGRGDIWL